MELEPLARERLAHDRDVLARALELLAEALAVPALARPAGRDEPMPSSMRPPESWSSVAAVIAVIAAERPGIWKIAEPMLDLVVCPASQPRIVAASEP